MPCSTRAYNDAVMGTSAYIVIPWPATLMLAEVALKTEWVAKRLLGGGDELRISDVDAGGAPRKKYSVKDCGCRGRVTFKEYWLGRLLIW